MRKLLLPIALIASICLLAACGSPPKRTPYTGSDLVGVIDPTLFVGNWKISVLNPIGDENKATVTQSFNQDGTWVSTVIPPQEQTAEIGPLQYEAQGDWQVNGDVIVSKLGSMEETTGNKFGAIMKTIASAFMPKSSAANVYELSNSRIILVHEETGTATLLERI